MNENRIENSHETPAAPATHTPPPAAEALREKLQSDRDAHRVRNGKIAALPTAIRSELNLRLERGERGPALLGWLNAQPAVLQALQQHFQAIPVSKQNLAAWRQGGYLEWQMRQELTQAASDLYEGAHEVNEMVDRTEIASSLVTILTAQYALLLNRWDGEPDPKFAAKLQILRRLSHDVALLQKCADLATKQEAEMEREYRLAAAHLQYAHRQRLLAQPDAASPSDNQAHSPADDPDPVEEQPQTQSDPVTPPIASPAQPAAPKLAPGERRRVKPSQGQSRFAGQAQPSQGESAPLPPHPSTS